MNYVKYTALQIKQLRLQYKYFLFFKKETLVEDVNENQESLISNSLIENDEFYDTVSQMTNANSLLLRRKSKRKSFNSRTSLLSKSPNMIKSKLVSPFVQVNYNEVSSLEPLYERIKSRQRRTEILRRPTDQSSLKMLKDLLKNAIGKDLS